ncbi:MAG: PLDc N-terminal domain-containing protein, partial [Acetatifactor sp.]|nr:PLDc N-terminal domain-containing protein [Acetatifactor sp.]
MKKLDYEKKKKIKNIKTVIYGRTAVVLLAVFVQFLLLFLSLVWLRDYSGLFFTAFTIISAVVVLHLFNVKGAPDVKLTWMLPIAVFPVFGGIFYLFIQLQLGTQVLQRRVKQLFELRNRSVKQNEDVRDRMAEENAHMGQFADYMLKFNNSPVYDHTQITYYSLGDHQFPDVLEELKKAEKFIFLEYFIVEEGLVWNSILDILKEKVRDGVEVRMMYDGMCSLALLPTSYPKQMQSFGIQCKIFSQIYPIFSSHYNNRDHRKILVIDGKVAFTGGTNLADEYINRKLRFGHWKDCAVKIRGNAVERFTDMFLEMWN